LESGDFAESLDSFERLFPDDECFEASVFYVIQGWCLNRLGKKEESLRSFIKAATFSQDHEEKEFIESAIPHRIDTLYNSNYFGCYHEKIRKGV
jgi:predicted RNA polymerase sigma factor